MVNVRRTCQRFGQQIINLESQELFIDWFNNFFIKEVDGYLKSINLEFKILLLIDNAPGHPLSLRLEHPTVEVVFFITEHRFYNLWIKV